MSLSRLALRLATVEALAPFSQYEAAAPQWPTLAEGRVLDSEIGPLDYSLAAERRPLIAVYTDDSKRDGNGTAPDVLGDGEEIVTLGVEIVVPAVVEQDGVAAVLPVPTDSAAEAWLDLAEAQVAAALDRARYSGVMVPLAAAFRKTLSQPQRDPDLGTRLSARRLEFDCKIKSSPTVLEFAADADLLDRLPEPLRSVVKRLVPGSPGRALAEGIATALVAPQPFAALEAIRLAVNLTRPAGATPPPPVDPAATPPAGDITAQMDLT